ncbi:TRAP transporter small permease [Salibacterium lacus]|uniref:TRAP transporter small permease n=1 Tax=Salibacterium lacus TaxID=1898109 RepID=A0ABW5T1B4_9BACI
MKILRFLDRYIEEYLLIITTVTIVFTLFFQIVMRYVFSNSLPWTEELARYLFIWSVFIGVSYAVKNNKHLKIDTLSMVFKRKGKLVIRTISNVLFLVFSVAAVYYGFNTMDSVARTTPGLNISYAWVYASTLVGFTLTSIRIIQDQWKVLSPRHTNEVDEE